MEDWETAERVQTNDAGEKRALIGGSWVSVTKAQKNDEGQFRVMREPSVMNDRRAKEYNPKTSAKDFLLDKLKRAFVNTVSLPGLAADISQLPARTLGRLGVPGLERAGKEGLMSATAQTQKVGDELLNVDRTMLPPDALTKYLGNVAEFAGSSVIPSGLVIGAAKKMIPAALGEAAAITGGGVASQLGGDIAESGGHNRAWGEIPGGIGGATGGYGVAAATKLGGAAEAGGKALTNKAGKQIGEIVKAENLQPKLDASMDVAKHIESVTGIPFEPTLAGRTRSGFVSDLEQKVLGRDVGSAERAISKNIQNVSAVHKFMDETMPSGEPLQRSAGKTVTTATSNLEEAASKLAAERASVAGKTSGKSQQAVGQELDVMRAAKKNEVKAELSTRLGGIYDKAKSNNITSNMDDVVDLVKNIKTKEGNAFQSMPPVFREIADKYVKTEGSSLVDIGGRPLSKAKSDPASFEELHSLWKETNRQLAASKSLPDQTQTYYLGQLKDVLSKKVSQIESGKGKFAADFSQWNKDYSAYAKTFKEGIGGKMSNIGKFGETMTKEKIVSNFFSPTGIDDFNRIYKNDPVAKQLLTDGILDRFAQSVGIKITGEINPKTSATFLKNNAEALNKMPELKAKLSDSTKATELLLEKGARIEKAKTDLSKGILAQIAKVDDVTPIIAKALTDKKAFRQLMTTGAEGRKSIIHALSSSIPEAAQKSKMTISEFMAKNESNLKPILDAYGKEHYKNVKTAMDGMDMILAGKPPTHPALTQFNVDPIAALTGTTMPSLISQYRATMITRQSSPTHMVSSMMSRFWAKTIGANAEKMQEYLLTNPQAAKDFAAATKATKSTMLSNKISNHALAAGARSTTASLDSMSKEQK